MSFDDEVNGDWLEVSEEVPEEVPEESEADDIVQQVLNGEWGVGQERRLRLAKAGYDHLAIQREIVKRSNT